MVFEKVAQAIANQLSIDAATVKIEQSLIEDLKADSLDVVALIMDLEQEFDIQIPDEDLMNIKKVSDIVAYIEARV